MKAMERLSIVERLIIIVQNSLVYDVCSNIVIYTLRDLNTLTTDQVGCEAVISVPTGTMD